MNQSSCFVTQVDISIAPQLREDLTSQGFEISTPQYTLFQAKKRGVSCTLYKSGKLTVQGRDKGDFITFYLEPIILGAFTYSHPETELDYTPHIGVDEAGKGDVFGPLCIGAVYADTEGISKLSKMGVKDSKKMTDSTITRLGENIRKSFFHSVIKIFPQRYNELYEKFRNLNTLLAWGHATAIEEVQKKTSCSKVTIDKFANENVVVSALKRKGLEIDLTQRHRGEEDIVVAAASIVARTAFVEGMEKLSTQYQIKLPKGASPPVIEAGRQFVRKYGREALPHIAKMHFRTLKEILS